MLGGCEDGMDLFEVSSPLVPDELPPTVVASPIYRGLGPLPKYRAGREPTTAKFEGGQLVRVILTKGGLRLPKALVVTPSWAPR